MDTDQQEAPPVTAPNAENGRIDRPDDQEAWTRMWQVIDQIGERNQHLDPDGVYRHVTEVVEEVRQERYEREQRAAAERQQRSPADGR